MDKIRAIRRRKE
jgi:hypothetical protein